MDPGQRLAPDPVELVRLARSRVEGLPRQLRALHLRGVHTDDVVSSVLLACVRRHRAGCGWDPDRGELGAWVWLVARAVMGHMLDRIAQPGLGSEECVSRGYDLSEPACDPWHRPSGHRAQGGRTRRRHRAGR